MSKMIADPEAYFRTLLPERDEVLHELEKEAKEQGIPIVGPAVGILLTALARFAGVRRVLEFGTATGYSTIFLARGCTGDGARVLSLEKEAAMARRARENCRRAGVGSIVEVHEGDAVEAAAALSGPFDMVFLDIEKRDYVRALPDCRRLLRPGGLLVADNVAFSEADAFNRTIAADRRWQTAPLYAFLPAHSPEHDGLVLAVRL